MHEFKTKYSSHTEFVQVLLNNKYYIHICTKTAMVNLKTSPLTHSDMHKQSKFMGLLRHILLGSFNLITSCHRCLDLRLVEQMVCLIATQYLPRISAPIKPTLVLIAG